MSNTQPRNPSEDGADLALQAGPRLRHVVIVGLMGSGKTTVAAGLASWLGWSLVDNDAQLDASVGRSADEIAATMGLERLHDIEARLLVDALAEPGPSVIAAAASTIERAECRTALGRDDTAVVWLRGSPSVLAERAAAGSHRPGSASTAAALHSQATIRSPLYRAIADLVVDVDGMTPSAILVCVGESLSGLDAPAGDGPDGAPASRPTE